MHHSINRLLSLTILRNRLLIFLIALMILLVTFPLVHEERTNLVILVELLTNLLLIFGIYVITDNRKVLTISILVAILAFTVIWFNVFLQSKPLLAVGLLLEACFFAMTLVVILRYVLSYKRITADKIYGAICGYLLIGLIFTFIFTVLENIQPGSFAYTYGVIASPEHYLSHRYYFAQFSYFSFVTISTLGYGDIVPLSTAARTLSALEGIIGQLYVAVLIARLVGLHIGHIYFTRKQHDEGEGK